MPAEDFVGLTGPVYEMDVERGKIREFARAMHAPLPEFMQGRHPVIPATFLVTAAYTWGYSLERPRGTVFETIDHDLSVPLHAEEAFTFHGPPPRAGDRLTCQARLEDVRRKSGAKAGDLTFLTVLTQYHDQSDRLVVEQRSTTVTTGQAPAAGDWNVEIPPYRPRYTTLEPRDQLSHIDRARWDDLTEGEGPEPVDAGPLHLQDIVRFQGVVGEDNPLHFDKAWAASLEYPTVFGLGMHQASALAGVAAHWLDPAAVRHFRARFRNVYWPGDRMIYAMQVARKYRDTRTGDRMIDLELRCTRSGDEPLVEAWMIFNLDETSG